MWSFSVGERKITRTLKGKDGCESGFYDVAVDPMGVFIAAMSKEGYLVVWDIESGDVRVAKQLITFDENPNDLAFMEEMDTRSRICWRPDGSLLAVPGVTGGGISLLSRNSFKQAFKLNGGHQRRVLQIFFSPNGYVDVLCRRNLWVNSKGRKRPCTEGHDLPTMYCFFFFSGWN